MNRVLTDRLSDLLLVPSRDAIGNLLDEGLSEDRIVFAGNVMIDTLYAQLPAARGLGVPVRLGFDPGGYCVVTLHRPSNVDERESLEPILDALGRIAADRPVVFPIHPRTAARAAEYGFEGKLSRLHVVEPLSYREMIGLVESAAVVLTDSGGLQEETTVLGVPCVTLRENTERPITIEQGTNRLAPWPLTVEGIVESYGAATASRDPARTPPEGWDGRAAERIADALRSRATAPRRGVAPEPARTAGR